jgi:hypothetical protein
MTTCSTIVEVNNWRAAAVASGEPASTKITWRPDSNSVSGPNMGCSEVTRQTVRLERVEPGAQWRLQRAEIEDHALRPAHGQLAQDLVGDAERCRDHDEVVLQLRAAPVGEVREPRRRAGRIGDLTAKPCDAMNSANQRPILPAPPITQRAAPRAGALRRDARLLLGS